MTPRTIIYVAMLQEAVDVWRPVEAEHLGGDNYLIVDQAYDRDSESWQFEPGEHVVCKEIQSAEGLLLAAVSKGTCW